MNQDMQQQFVSWLTQKLQAKDEQDLKSKVQQMGQDGIKQAYQAFMQEQQQGAQQVPSQADGGKLDYLRCLKAYKKGGAMAMKDCGCDDSKKEMMKSGGRVDKNENAVTKDYMGSRNDAKGNGMAKHKDERMDKNKQDANPGKKDWMSKGKKKDWTTAKVGADEGKSIQWTSAVTKVPKGKEGMITPAQKKMIAMKEMDEKKASAKKKVNAHQQGGLIANNSPRTMNPPADKISSVSVDEGNPNTPGNYTKTNDPDTYMGKFGAPIKRSEYQSSLKNGMNFKTFEDYADWVGGWAHPMGQDSASSLLKGAQTPNSSIPLSDKARGLASGYYPANAQQQGGTVPVQEPSNYQRRF